MFKLRRAAAQTLAAALVGGCLVAASSVSALSTSDRAAGILVWPKVVADPSGSFGVCTAPLGKPCSVATQATDCPNSTCLAQRNDTFVSIDNTSSVANGATKLAHCFLVNANSHCENSPSTVCNQSSQCVFGQSTGRCVPGWQETDFNIRVTPEQPLGWYASQGKSSFALDQSGTCSATPALSCTSANDCPAGQTCNVGQSNVGSLIPPVGEIPFQGSIKCIEYALSNPEVPDHTALRNSLMGNAAIVTQSAITGSPVDVSKYNAVGLQATANAVAPTNTLQIGRSATAVGGAADPTQEYAACPSNLILPHLFDGATDPIGSAPSPGVSGTVRTELTLVPCGDDFSNIEPGVVTAQFLVYNEFEQRFSASTKVDCYLDKQLSLIDTSNPVRSIWAAGVAGTLAGQTRIRGTGNADTGRGLLGVANFFVRVPGTNPEASTAYNLSQQGEPKDGTKPDLIILP